MKRTPCPVIAAAALTLALLASAPARAQAPAGDAGEADLSALTDQARELYDQGTRAAGAKQWTEAHAAFLAAWEIKPHYQIAINLAAAEAKLGKPRDTAEHAAFYLRDAPADRKDPRRRAQALLDEAKKKIAIVTFLVDIDGADLKLDRRPFGKSPADNPLFLLPGPHTFEANIGKDRHTYSVLILNAGDNETVSLVVPPPEKPAPARSTPGLASTVAPSAAMRPTDASDLSAATDTPVDAPARVPLRALLGLGYGMAGVAAGAGIVFTVLARSRSLDATDSRDALASAYGSRACDDASLATYCGALDELFEDRATFTTAAVWSFVAAGVIGAGTTVYAVLKTPKRAAVPGIAAIPMVTPQGGAIVLTGVW